MKKVTNFLVTSPALFMIGAGQYFYWTQTFANPLDAIANVMVFWVFPTMLAFIYLMTVGKISW